MNPLQRQHPYDWGRSKNVKPPFQTRPHRPHRPHRHYPISSAGPQFRAKFNWVWRNRGPDEVRRRVRVPAGRLGPSSRRLAARGLTEATPVLEDRAQERAAHPRVNRVAPGGLLIPVFHDGVH